MHVPKWMAVFGFHFCTTIFVGLSLYGALRYVSVGLAQPDSLLAAGAYATVLLASVAGICFFGREADRRKAEESRTPGPNAPVPAKRKKS